jgi:hypothetical protein
MKFLLFPLYPLTALVFVLGAGMFAYSFTLPYYTDENKLPSGSDVISNVISKQEYYKREAELRTNKLRFMDTGSGLAVAAATLLLFLALSRIKSRSDLRRLKTPGRASLYVLSNLAWLLVIPANIHYYNFTAMRGDYPSFADSIAIPIFQTSVVVIALIIPLNLLILLTTIKSNFPAKLLSKFSRYSTASIFWEIFWGCLLLLSVSDFVTVVVNGKFLAIPLYMYFIYFFLCLRAGKVGRLNRKYAEQLKA